MCIDTSDLFLKGFWDEPEVHYLEIILRTCQNNSNINKIPCKSKEIIDSLLVKEKYYFSVFIENHNLNPYDLEHPIQISLKNSYIKLEKDIRKSKSSFFKMVNVMTDQSYFYPSYKETILYKKKNDDYDTSIRRTEDDPLVGMFLYSADEVEYIEITNDHILNLLTQLGGFAKFIMTIGFILTLRYNNMIKEEELINSIYSFDLNQKTEIIDIDNMEINENLNKIWNSAVQSPVHKNNRDFKVNEEIAEKEIDKKEVLLEEINKINYLTRFNSDNKIVSFETGKSPTKISKTDKEEEINYEKNQSPKVLNTVSLKMKLEKIKEKEAKSEKIKFSFLEKIKILFFPCCTRKMNRKRILFEKSMKIMNQSIDILEILKKIQEIEKLKISILNKNQIALFNFMAKPLISLKDNQNQKECNFESSKVKSSKMFQSFMMFLNNKEELIKDIICYYSLIINRKMLSEIDKRLFSLLDDNIKNLIICENKNELK